MDTNQEPTFDQDLSTIVSQLPPPIKTFFVSGKVEIIAKNLMQKNQLHIDQGAIVEREIILLLLGLKTPTEFTQALAEEARLDPQVTSGIVQDINAQIFMPLREEMRKGMSGAAEPAKTVAPKAAQPASHFHLENKLPARSAPPVPPRPASNIAPLPPKTVLPRSGGLPATRLPVLKPIDTSRLLEDHEEPHIEFPALPTPISMTKAPRPLQRAAETPLQQALRTVLPRPAGVSNAGSPPPNLPGALSPRIPPKVEPSISQTQPKPAQPVVPPPAPARPYSSDPYREPIE
ncbi:MAG: hypothetical protein WC814_00325 [Candidatus Paceibacterota bacterium]|jgi:hypothetical protein